MNIPTPKPDPKNPRRQSPEKATALSRALYEYGDLGGIVENVRTGELVGGHQRVTAFRSDPEARYEITETLDKPDRVGTIAYGFAYALGTRFAFRRVDWPVERQRAANVVANSPEVQGEWDDTIEATLAQIKVDFPDLSSEVRIDELLAGIREEMGEPTEETPTDQTYTNKIVCPVYTPKGEKPPVSALIDRQKTGSLLAGIDAANLPAEVAQFLRLAAERHTVFNFRQIAEFYCHADAKTQDLMERSGLVIIDFKKAIEYGFVHLTERLGALADQEEADNADA